MMSHRKSSNNWISIFVFCLLINACGGGDSNTPQQPDRGEQIALDLVEEVLTIMQTNAITRNEINWDNVRAEVSQLTNNVASIEDTYPAITRALELINTNHSLLVSSTGSVITYPSNVICSDSVTINLPNSDHIGYIKVDGFSGSRSEGIDLAQSIQQNIADQDSANLLGWIVDLRENSGGNMWPMVTGLGPLFDQELLGHFIGPNEEIVEWGYRNGSSFSGSSTVITAPLSYELNTTPDKIAVLSSRFVASSGEATLIAFKKQANVRIFGNDTCGLSTANTPFPLSNGTTLLLTTDVIADREQEKYGQRVPVDEPSSATNALENAIKWIQN